MKIVYKETSSQGNKFTRKCVALLSSNLCSQSVESGFYVLISAVYLCDVVNATCALCAECGDEQSDSSADIRARHAACTQLNIAVMTYDYAAVRVAEYNLCAHIYELVDEEESTLEHLLVNKYRSAGLSCNHDEHRKQVWRESGPRRIGKSHDRAVEKRVDNIVRLVRKGVKHVLSHRVIYANFYEVILPENSASFAKYQRISVEDLHKFAVSRLVNQFFSLILEPNN